MWTTFSTFSDNRDDDGKKNSNQLYFTFTLLYFLPFMFVLVLIVWLTNGCMILVGFLVGLWAKDPPKRWHESIKLTVNWPDKEGRFGWF